ncbi:unnamed protein product [Prunus armeniaca]
MRSPGAVSLNAAKSPAIEVIDYPCLSKKMFFLILDEVKSTVTDPGQSHLSTVAIPNVLPTTFALTLNEGSSPMSMDFHPTWQTLLLFGTWGVGDIGLWDVSSGKKLLSRNFRVLNLDAGPMALKFIFTAVVFFIQQGLHMQSALCNYILILEATTIGSHEAPVYSVCAHTKENVHVRATLGIDVVVLCSTKLAHSADIQSPRSRTQYKDHSNQYCVVYWTADPGPNPAIISKVPCYIIYFTTYFTGELKPGQKEDLELPLFDLAAVVCATKNFSNNNKLGEGGFGSVFKQTRGHDQMSKSITEMQYNIQRMKSSPTK